MLDSSRTSRCVTVRRSSPFAEEGKSLSNFWRRESGSERAVATIGAVVVLRRCRVIAKPIPREDGVVRIQGRSSDAVGCILNLVLRAL